MKTLNKNVPRIQLVSAYRLRIKASNACILLLNIRQLFALFVSALVSAVVKAQQILVDLANALW